MDEAKNGARGEDTNTFKYQIVEHLTEDYSALDPALLDKEDKSKRGWNHTFIASLLCPINLDANEV